MKRTQTVNRLCLIPGLYHLKLWILKEIANSYHNQRKMYNKKKKTEKALNLYFFHDKHQKFLISKARFKKKKIQHSKTKNHPNRNTILCLSKTDYIQIKKENNKGYFCHLCLINCKHKYLLVILAYG